MEGAHVSDQTLDELSQALELVQDNENQEWSTEEDQLNKTCKRGRWTAIDVFKSAL